MAQNYKYNETKTKKFTIKGYLSGDGKNIDYVNADKEEKTIGVEKVFSKFGGQQIELTVAVKTDDDLTEEFEEE